MKKIIYAVSFLGLTSSCWADWTINFSIDGLRNSSGVFVPASSLVLLVADMNNNGYTAPVANFSTALDASWGSDDKVIARFSDVTNNINGVFDAAIMGSDIYAGKNIAMYWFPTLSLASTVMAGGTSYGTTSTFLTPTGWTTPASSGTTNLTFLGQNSTGNLGSGIYTNAQMTAGVTVSAIPEPSTFAALFGAAALGMAAYRRRRPAA